MVHCIKKANLEGYGYPGVEEKLHDFFIFP